MFWGDPKSRVDFRRVDQFTGSRIIVCAHRSFFRSLTKTTTKLRGFRRKNVTGVYVLCCLAKSFWNIYKINKNINSKNLLGDKTNATEDDRERLLIFVGKKDGKNVWFPNFWSVFCEFRSNRRFKDLTIRLWKSSIDFLNNFVSIWLLVSPLNCRSVFIEVYSSKR